MTKIEHMKIEIWSDFSCPFCYMGKIKFEKALEEFVHKDKVDISYKAFQLNPDAPKQTTLDSYTAFSKAKGIPFGQVKTMFMHTANQAKELGLDFKMDKIVDTQTLDAHRLAKWAEAKKMSSKVIERFMKAYFEEGHDLSNQETLLKLIGQLHLPLDEAKEALISDFYQRQVQKDLDEAMAYGISGVPLFLIDQKYAISGAQSVEYFKHTLNQLWEKEHQIKVFSDGDMCDVSGC